MSKRIVIIGGGTFQPIRNHLSLAAPAFGKTARLMNEFFLFSGEKPELYLTKMADSTSKLITNEHVEQFIYDLIDDKTVGTIVMNVALCDYKALPIDDELNGWHGKRLKTSEGDLELTLTPTDKLIGKIRKERPDIFLVGFKTTTDETSDEQFLIALKMMKASKCNLVFANDTVTRNNMIITPEETIYSETTNRFDALYELVDMTLDRHRLTYHRGIFNEVPSIPFSDAPPSFRRVIKFLLDNGGYIENNGNGFTPGHFCYRNFDVSKSGPNSLISSQRKVNHNDVETNGMTFVHVEEKDDEYYYYGMKKPSVGARSQHMMLKNNPKYDYIVHTHNPLKVGSLVPTTPQRPFQCGSLECGMNTVNHMGEFDNGIKAVFLEKHGINLLFKRTTKSEDVIQFLKDNIELGIKIK